MANPSGVNLQLIARGVLQDHGFWTEMPADALRQAEQAVEPNLDDAGVRDLSAWLWSSIDNDDSRDLDQIEYLETGPGGTRLYVGIADVSAFVAPDSAPEFSDAPVATNHRGQLPEYPERARRLRSVPRRDHLSTLLAADPGPDDLAAAFLADPLYNREYSAAFGTLYTALYRPAEKVVDFRWPDLTWRRGFDDPDGTREVVLFGS